VLGNIADNRQQGINPGGIVSRAVFEAVFPLLDAVARIPVCGLIAHYTTPKHPRRHGPHP
jgi:NADPH-dependent curcumin reductase CurA